MALPKNFQFPGPADFQAEASRRAAVLFGEDWRAVCVFCADRLKERALSSNDSILSFANLRLRVWQKDRLFDLSDGSPSEVAYYPNGGIAHVLHFLDYRRNDPSDGRPASVEYYANGALRSVRHFSDDTKTDTTDGTPAFVNYSESGEISSGFSSICGSLTAEETIAMLKAAQVNRVAALLEKADQAVIPSGMPQPKDFDGSGPGGHSKDGR